MSSMPPNMPPGGGMPPYPPYDPKTQWRVYREQQKAAWRAQRDAWKAQQNAWKVNNRGICGPRLPSIVGPVLLVSVGVVAVLIQTGHLPAANFWEWYTHWWPMLLIVAGLAMLAEWGLDMRRQTPVRRSGGFIGILIFLAIVGMCSSRWHHGWAPFHSQWNDNTDDFFNSFGLPEHATEQQAQTAQIAPNATVDIENPRGDVNVTAGDGNTLQVQAHEVAYANSDSDARNVFDNEAAKLTVSGTAVTVRTNSESNGRVNLTVTVPKSAHVTVNSGKGDVTAAGLGGGLNIASVHGSTHLDSITGPVVVHFTQSHDRQDFSVQQLDGDLTTEGTTNDITLSGIKGRITMSGEIIGDVHMEKIGGPISLHTPVTDLQLASLAGDLTLDSDDLRVVEAKGSVRVTTHSKDVELSQIDGDIYVEDRDGRIALEPAGNHNVEATNAKGDVELTLAPNATAHVEVSSRNGDVVSDFPSPSFGEATTKVASFNIGSGGAAHLVLKADNGDVRIKRGSTLSSPEAPSSPPSAQKAPHLKGSTHDQQQGPVTQ